MCVCVAAVMELSQCLAYDQVNILDVTQPIRIQTQQLAAKCRSVANISSRVSDDRGKFCTAERPAGQIGGLQFKLLTQLKTEVLAQRR